MSDVSPIPAGSEGLTPYLVCKGAAAAIDFYKRAFGAVELYRIGSDENIGHAEMKIGDSIFMLADEAPDYDAISPQTLGGSPVSLMLYVEDVDQFVYKAIIEGLEVVRPVEKQFYGDRSGHFRDPFGHMWTFATHIEDVSPEEMNRRAAELFGG